MTHMTQAEYARFRGISRQAVSKAVKAGRIPIGADGLINVTQVDAKGNDPAQASATAELTVARTVLASFKAKHARLEYELRIGQLVELEDMKRAAEDCGAVVKQEFEQFAGKLDDILSAFSTGGRPAAAAVMKQAIFDSLTTVTEKLLVLAGEGTSAERPDGDAPAKH